MTLLQTSAIDELCNTLGLRAPYPIAQRAAAGADTTAPLNDEQLTALGVLASPEAIAVIAHRPSQVTHVLAVRGPWLAEHVIDGATHQLRTLPADHAAVVLLDRCGFAEFELEAAIEPGSVDVPIAAYRRTQELIRNDDCRRARATLMSEGVALTHADALVNALRVGVTDVAGLASDGRRFTGCELAVAGNALTGRFLVPTSQTLDPLPRSAFHHPSLRNVRILAELVSAEALQDELSLIFGDL